MLHDTTLLPYQLTSFALIGQFKGVARSFYACTVPTSKIMSNFKKALCWELHISRFSFYYHEWRAFYYTPVSGSNVLLIIYHCFVLMILVATTENLFPMDIPSLQVALDLFLCFLRFFLFRKVWWVFLHLPDILGSASISNLPFIQQHYHHYLLHKTLLLQDVQKRGRRPFCIL